MNRAEIEEAADLLCEIDDTIERVKQMDLSLEFQSLSHNTTFMNVTVKTDELMRIINQSLKEKKARLRDLGVLRLSLKS